MSETKQGLRSFDGAVAVITGGASGIGRALATSLARRGCDVVLADRQHELADEVARQIIADGGTAHAEELDVVSHQRFTEVIEAARTRTGRLDYLFNNAGIGVGGETSEMTLEHWHSIIDVNIRGVANGIHAAYPLMQNQGFGHIVNTASIAGLTPTPLLTAYTMTKHAVVGLSTSLRSEARAFGVRVSALCPGLIRTPIITGGKYGEFVSQTDSENIGTLLEKYIRPYDVDRFARKAIRAIARNQAIIVVPWIWRLSWWLYRCSPTLTLTLNNFTTAHARQAISTLPVSGSKPQR